MSPPKSIIPDVADADAGAEFPAINPGVQPLSPQLVLAPEFFDLIYEADPFAADDIYYVASSEFTELHSDIKSGLLRGVLLWSLGLTMVLTSAIYLGLQS